jgi:Flp pilus assembly protein TadB
MEKDMKCCDSMKGSMTSGHEQAVSQAIEETTEPVHTEEEKE